MKKTVKRYAVLAAAMVIYSLMDTTAFAAGWIQNDTGWWYGTNKDNTRWHSVDSSCIFSSTAVRHDAFYSDGGSVICITDYCGEYPAAII